MSTETRATATINGRPNAGPAVIRPTNLADQQLPGGVLRILPAWIISGVVHVLLLLLFFALTWNYSSASGTVDQPTNDGQIDDTTTVQADLTETEVGIDKTAG